VGEPFDHWGQPSAFGLSFAVIARYWILLPVVRIADRLHARGPLGENAVVGDDRVPAVAGGDARPGHREHPRRARSYIGSVLASSASLNPVRFLIGRAPEVHDDSMERSAGLVTTGLIAVALVVAVSVPVIGMWAMLLMLLTARWIPSSTAAASGRPRERAQRRKVPEPAGSCVGSITPPSGKNPWSRAVAQLG
jgi:hypothetical protein